MLKPRIAQTKAKKESKTRDAVRGETFYSFNLLPF